MTTYKEQIEALDLDTGLNEGVSIADILPIAASADADLKRLSDQLTSLKLAAEAHSENLLAENGMLHTQLDEAKQQRSASDLFHEATVKAMREEIERLKEEVKAAISNAQHFI